MVRSTRLDLAFFSAGKVTRRTWGTIGASVAALIFSMPALAATLTVSNLNDSGDGSLRQCLQAGGAGDIIEFDSGLTGTLLLTGGSLNITSDVAISGPGAAVIAISGNDSNRIFTATNASPFISGLTFTDGYASDGRNGGVLYQQGGLAIFSNCVFQNNRANGVNGLAGGFGGAIYVTNGEIGAYGCIFSNNAAVGPAGLPQDAAYYAGGGGGGAGLGGALCVAHGTGTLVDCVFVSNSITGGAGGRGAWGGTMDGGHGGGPAGGAGGIIGHLDGYDGGEFSGGGGGKSPNGAATRGGNGGFGGGGGGAGAYNPSGPGGSGGAYAGSGGGSQSSGGGGGGGAGGLGGAVFLQDGQLTCYNVLFADNSAVGGNGGSGAISGRNGQGMGGAIFLYRATADLQLTFFSNNYPNAVDELIILGTNGAAIGNGEPADVDKGTDFGTRMIGSVVTNVLTITNAWAGSIAIGNVTTSGTGAAFFSVAGLPANLPAGAASNFMVVFHPAATGYHTCTLSISNSSLIGFNLINLAGTAVKSDQTITNFAPTNGSVFAANGAVGLSAQASSGLPVSFNVAAGPAIISGDTNLSFTGAGQVSIVASQPGDATWNPAPNLTNVFMVEKAEQAALIFNPASPQTYNTSQGLRLTGGSGTGAESFTVLSGPGQITGGTNLVVTAGAGSVLVRAAKAADVLYNERAVTAQVVCAKASQTIVFPAISDKILTNVVTLSATASSGLPVTFAVARGPGRITNSSMLAFTGTGTVVVTARQPGNSNWNASATASNSVRVLPVPVGSLQVTLLPAEAVANGAMWRVDGGAWRTSGTTITGLAAGAHTVSFKAVAGYNTPGNQAVNIQNNLLSALEKQYTLTAGDARYTPVAADYDGDGQADPGVYRPSDGSWRWRMSNNAYNWFRYNGAFGRHGCTPVAADFDGDGLADMGLYNSTNGEWRALLSSTDYREMVMPGSFGGAGWMALAADFDGDRKADPTVYHPATGDWKMRLSTQAYQQSTRSNLLGGTGFTAAAEDIDGDGLADPCVCNMVTGECKALKSSRNYALLNMGAGYLGAPGQLFMLSDMDGDGLADPAICDPTTGTLKTRLSNANYEIKTWTGLLKP